MYHIWTLTNREKHLDKNSRSGLRLRHDTSVDPEVRNACKNFAKWLRIEYRFPIRIPIYVKSAERIRTTDGDSVVGSFFEPTDYSVEPYIRIAAGDYTELKNSIGKDNALATILASIAHELTHYFQWINNLELTPMGRERQATQYARFILDEYAVTREHP